MSDQTQESELQRPGWWARLAHSLRVHLKVSLAR